MLPISAMKERNGVRPLSIISNNSTSDNERKELNVASNYDDMLVALPTEIRELIIQKLDIADYHCFGAVCKSWRSIAIAAKQNQNFCLQQLPWLLLFSNNFQDGHHGFFSLSHGKVFKLKLPEVHGVQCCGSSWGWLIMTNHSGENFLLNPFSRSRIQLPSETKLPNFTHCTYTQKGLCTVYIGKAMLMSPPAIPLTASNRSDIELANNDCVIAAIYNYSFLVFCRPGDQAWTYFENSQLSVAYRDIIFYNDHLYVVTDGYDLILIELGRHPKGTKLNMPCPEGYDPLFPKDVFIYLVESCGELLMVVRHWNFSLEQSSLSPITTMFEVFKLDPSGPRWIKVDSLGDQMLFVGTSNGISLSARHFSGFMGNCIYFTHESFAKLFVNASDLQTLRDFSVFSLEDGTIKSFFPIDSNSSLSTSICLSEVSYGFSL
ncbi:hypothetical protein F0562_011802 [Nyssa sinensis]|uniref:F-box domain-containing protein n=1 Tax=Nyssa sinensis TaxID=561372 RepID=A0A5J4ZQR9_9ASTE|nr:hypothetical protein F0562_011802 [Nyssa sinensis]